MSVPHRRSITRVDEIDNGSPAPGRAYKALLACGVISSLLYPVANDVIAAWRYEGYSSVSDTISELSAIGAPPRSLLLVLLVVYELLLIAFGIAVWQAAGARRGLRVTAGLIVAFGVVGLVGFAFPISQPGGLETEPHVPMMHLVLAGWVPPLLMLPAMGFGAAALGKRFRIYSILTIVVVLSGGVWAGMDAARVAGGGEPSQWTGLMERVNIWPWLLWIAVLAVTLLRAEVNRPRTSQEMPGNPGRQRPKISSTAEPQKSAIGGGSCRRHWKTVPVNRNESATTP